MQAMITKKNAATYKAIAHELVKMIPAKELPLSPENSYACSTSSAPACSSPTFKHPI